MANVRAHEQRMAANTENPTADETTSAQKMVQDIRLTENKQVSPQIWKRFTKTAKSIYSSEKS